MSKAKQKGTQFESACRDYENNYLGSDTVDRLSTGGINDRGDLGWVYSHGQKIVQECKNRTELRLKTWLEEAERERGNADALAGVVISKRRGIGDAHMGDQLVVMTLRDFMAIITGYREDD